MKFFSLILILVMVFSLMAGCRMGNQDDTKETAGSNGTVGTSSTTGTTAPSGTTTPSGTDGKSRSGMPGMDFDMGR